MRNCIFCKTKYISTHIFVFKSHHLNLDYPVAALNLNAFLHKTETAVQGTLTGIFLPHEGKVQVNLNLFMTFQPLVLEAFLSC